jgi:hypothetical protein
MILQMKKASMVFRIASVIVAAEVLLCFALSPRALAKAAGEPAKAHPLETVSGVGCYAYGDNETPAQAKQAAQTIAQEKAVRSHRVFVQSATKVRNFQLEDNVIQTASAGMLEQIKVEKEEKKPGQEICVTISAKLSPVSIEEMIQQRINAKDIAQEAAKSKVLSASSGFGVRLWTNKEDGQFIEGERLMIYVTPERDGYLQLDYFQADGTVVHLVPNLFSGQVMVKAGQTYVFGDDTSSQHFVIQHPFGNETVKAMLSAQPAEMAVKSEKPVEDSRDYLKILKAGTRGVGLVGVEQAVSLVTVSKAVREYQETRK